MASERKAIANKRNSKSSRGPNDTSKTRFNALKHGILSIHALILGGDGEENEKEFQQFSSAILRDLAPLGAVEELLVDDLIVIAWRKRRVIAYESAVLSKQLDTTVTDYQQEHSVSDASHANLPRELVEEIKNTDKRKWISQESGTLQEDEGSVGTLDDAIREKYGPETVERIQHDRPNRSDPRSLPGVLTTIVAAMNVPYHKLFDDDFKDLNDHTIQGIVRSIAERMGVPVEKILSPTNWWEGETYPKREMKRVIKTACEMKSISEKEFWSEVRNNLTRRYQSASEALVSYVLQEDREIKLAGLPDDSSLAKIQRYEAHLSRQFYRALHELQRLQAARLGLRPSIPLSIDT